MDKTINISIENYISYIVIATIYVMLMGCHDFNLFKIADNLDQKISEADDLDLLFLLDNKDIEFYLRRNKDKRDDLIKRLSKKEALAKNEEKITPLLNIIKIISKTTEISNILLTFSWDWGLKILDKDDLNLEKEAEKLYKNIKGKNKAYVSNFISYGIDLQNAFMKLGQVLTKDSLFPSEIKDRKIFYGELAFISSVYYMFYRFHKVINISGSVKNPICKIAPPVIKNPTAITGCLENEDDYKDVLIKFLTNSSEYKEIFKVTKITSFKVATYFFYTGFLHDTDMVGADSNIKNILKTTGWGNIADEI